jgi:hypothetical protein
MNDAKCKLKHRLHVHSSIFIFHYSILLEFSLERVASAGGRSASLAAEIGDELQLAAGRHRLQARVSLKSHVPIDHLELVRNGVVVSFVPLDASRTQGQALVPLDIDQSGWYVVRAYADGPRSPVLDFYTFATTSPIYVTVADRPCDRGQMRSSSSSGSIGYGRRGRLTPAGTPPASGPPSSS